MIESLFKNVNWLEKGLDASWLRNQTIANNIANVDTVGFKASHVEFESQFKEALGKQSLTLKTTRAKHFSSSSDSAGFEAKVVTDNNSIMRMDGNNVDIDYENAELAKNNIYYNTLVRQISSELKRLRVAINEGK